MAYRGLILDFAGVLATGIDEALARWCLREGLPSDAWHRTLELDWEGRHLYRALESGRLTQAEWNRETARILGVAEAENLMGRAWADIRRADEAIALAAAARESGMTLGLLSNSFGLEPYDPYAHARVWDLFDVAVISEREGVAKPDPEIYRRTLERMGLAGEECVFVDDQQGNLPPAAALGVTTVHADRGGEYLVQLSRLLGLPHCAEAASAPSPPPRRSAALPPA